MKTKALAIAAIILVIGAVAIALRKPDSTPGESATRPERTATPAAGSPTTGLQPVEPTSDTKLAREKEERAAREAELVSEYGEARTNLSRHVTGNVIEIFDDVLEMGEMMIGFTADEGSRFAADAALNRLDIELTDEQGDKALELYGEFQRRELEKTRDAVDKLRDEPTLLMSLMLASDAHSRGELGEDEYRTIQEANAAGLEGVINPLDRRNFRGNQDPLRDDAFVAEFSALLDEDQAATFESKLEERGDDPPREPSSIADMPVMDLENLDKAVGSAKQMTSGFKQMMEGMGNFRQLQPLMNQGRGD